MKIGIIGAGITGLYLAYDLAKKGHEIVVFEKDYPGGLAFGFPFNQTEEMFLEKYYHHIFINDAEIIQLIKENNLAEDLLWLKSKSGIYADNKIWNLGTSFDLLSFSPLGSIWQRLLMGINLFYFKATKKWGHLDKIKCYDLFRKRWNSTGYRNLWEPLLKQKFASGYPNIPAAFLWGRIHPRSKSRQQGQETLGYLKGGFQRLFHAMVQAIETHGGLVRANDPVLELIPIKQPQVIAKSGIYRFDRLIWTLATNLLPNFVKNLSSDIKDKANSIKYMAVTCLILVMKEQLSDYYWINNIDPEISYGGIIEHTNFVSPSYYKGKHIIYIINYHLNNTSLCQFNSQEVLQMHLSSLQKMYPNFKKEYIIKYHLFRDIHSSPLYDMNYSERIPPYRGWLPNIDICNMSQVYPIDRNMNNCIKNAIKYLSLY